MSPYWFLLWANLNQDFPILIFMLPKHTQNSNYQINNHGTRSSWLLNIAKLIELNDFPVQIETPQFLFSIEICVYLGSHSSCWSLFYPKFKDWIQCEAVSSCPSYWTLLGCRRVDICSSIKVGWINHLKKTLKVRSFRKACRTNEAWCRRMVYSSMKKQRSHHKFMITVSLCLHSLKIQEKFTSIFSLLLTWLLASRHSFFRGVFQALYNLPHCSCMSFRLFSSCVTCKSVSCLRLLLSSLAGFLAFLTTSLQSSNSSSDLPESLTSIAEAVEAELELLLLISLLLVEVLSPDLSSLELSLHVLFSTPSVKIGSRSKYHLGTSMSLAAKPFPEQILVLAFLHSCLNHLYFHLNWSNFQTHLSLSSSLSSARIFSNTFSFELFFNAIISSTRAKGLSHSSFDTSTCANVVSSSSDHILFFFAHFALFLTDFAEFFFLAVNCRNCSKPFKS